MDEPSVSPQRVTQLLADWSHGDDAALAELTPLVYEELRRLAHHFMEGQRPEHTLQTTALVNEAYLRLADQTSHLAFAAKDGKRWLPDYFIMVTRLSPYRV
jgi:hypothetical protein